MAVDKIYFMKDWYDTLLSDPNAKYSEQDIAYIIYACAIYCFEDEWIDIGEAFGEDYAHLNNTLSGFINQIKKMTGFNGSCGETPTGRSKNEKYDSDKIEELGLKGYTVVQIAQELGIPAAKSRSIYSNAGWKRAKEKLANLEKSVLSQSDSENNSESVLNSKNKTESVLNQSVSSESVLSKNDSELFNF